MNRRGLLKWFCALPFVPAALAEEWQTFPQPTAEDWANAAEMPGLYGDPIFRLNDGAFADVFGWHFADDGIARIYERGVLRGEFGTYTPFTVFQVDYDPTGLITYSKDKVIMFRSRDGHSLAEGLPELFGRPQPSIPTPIMAEAQDRIARVLRD